MGMGRTVAVADAVAGFAYSDPSQAGPELGDTSRELGVPQGWLWQPMCSNRGVQYVFLSLGAYPVLCGHEQQVMA